MIKPLIFLLTSLIYIFMSIHILIKDPTKSSNRLYALISFLFYYWALVTGILYFIKDPSTVATLRATTVICWGMNYSIISHLILILSGKDSLLSKTPGCTFLYLPAIVNLYLYLSDPVTAAELSFTYLGWQLSNTLPRGLIWSHYFNIYYIFFMILSIVYAIQWLNSTTHKREKIQAKLILYSIFIAFILGSLLEVILPMLGIPTLSGITVIVALIPITGMYLAIEKYSLMSFKPENLIPDVLPILDEGIIINDNDGVIYLINDGALSMLGFSSEDAPDNIIELLKDTDIDKLIHSDEIYLKGKDRTVEVIISTNDILDSVGEKYGEVSVFHDISALKSAQNNLRVLNLSLEEKVKKRTNELMITNTSLRQKIEEADQARKKIYNLAYYDYLTALPNKRYLTKQLKKEVIYHENENKVFALLFMDLDLFKIINDTMGHKKGDELLVTVSEKLKNHLSSEDFISRMGGDEFVIILKNSKKQEYIEDRVKSIMNLFTRPFSINKHNIFITCSIGVAIYGLHSKKDDELIKFADIAMYQAKDAGRNKYRIFNLDMKKKLYFETSIIEDLHKAVHNKSFELYYQPQIDSKDGSLVGLEALIRWEKEKSNFISPALFIPLAEKTSLIMDIGNWVIEEAIRQKSIWKKKGILNVPISINISVNQFIDMKIISFIKDNIDKYGISPSDLEIEVTESVIMDKYTYSIDILEELSSMGIKIVLDDFGIEYSSLKYLKTLPISTIKIDKSFIDGIGNKNKDEDIIRAIISLAKNLGYSLIAEGVEHECQIDFLTANSCYFIQGYYYSRPQPPSQIEESYTTSNNALFSL